jgi:hypothetical protein
MLRKSTKSQTAQLNSSKRIRMKKAFHQQGGRPLPSDQRMQRFRALRTWSYAGFHRRPCFMSSQAIRLSIRTNSIVDVGLPDRPGDELVAEIRAVRPDMPVILATGLADEPVRGRHASSNTHEAFRAEDAHQHTWPVRNLGKSKRNTDNQVRWSSQIGVTAS